MPESGSTIISIILKMRNFKIRFFFITSNYVIIGNIHVDQFRLFGICHGNKESGITRGFVLLESKVPFIFKTVLNSCLKDKVPLIWV